MSAYVNVKERVAERLEIPLETLISRGEIARPSNGPLHPEIQKALRGPATSYRPEFCQLVIEMANEGHSLGAFAGRIGISRPLATKWMRVYPEFGEACSRAGAGRLWFWETKLLHVANTGGSGSQGQVAIFGVLNAARTCENPGALDWVNKQEIEHSGNVSLANVVERMMDKLDEIAQGRKVQPGDDAVIIEAEQAVSAPSSDDFW